MQSAYYCPRCGFHGPNATVAHDGATSAIGVILYIAAAFLWLIFMGSAVGYYAADNTDDRVVFGIVGAIFFALAAACLGGASMVRRMAWHEAFCARCNASLGRVR